MKPALAYSYDNADDGCEILFARSEAGARALAKRQTGNRFEQQEVERRPCFDKYAQHTGQYITDAERFAEGWPVYCAWCGHTIQDGECWHCYDLVDDRAPVPVLDGEAIYCHERCRDNRRASLDRVLQGKERARTALLARFPFVDIKGDFVGSPGECKCFDRDRENITVRFKVPGGELSERTADGNAFHNLYCHGCHQVWIAHGDLEAWERLVVRPDAEVEEKGGRA